MSSVTGNADNVFINNANLKIAKAGKGVVFSDSSVLYTANVFNTQNVLSNIYQYTNAQTAFVINEVTSNTGFAGNTAPTDAISVSSNLFISYTGNLITFGQITAGSVANVESNILSLESDLSDNSSRIGGLTLSSVVDNGNTTSNTVQFTNTGTSLVTSGSVGVGTTSPSANLHVVGNVYATGNVNTALGTSMGIGTSSQSSVLSVVGTNPYNPNPIEAGIHIGQAPNGFATIEMVGTDSTCLIDFSSPGATGHFYRLISNLGSRNNLEIFAPGDTIALTVDQNSNVGIGTTSPSANLHVVGNVYATVNVGIGKTTPVARLEVAAGTGDVGAGNTRFFIYNASSLTTTTTDFFNDISIYADDDIVSKRYIVSSDGSLSSSDRRIKSNIQDISDTVALDQLRLLQPKTYNYKDTIKRGKEPVIGFIAQEVKEVIPEAVQKRKAEIPNIYEIANVSQSNVITFTNFNTSNLNANSNVINIRTVTNGDERITLANVIDEHTIQVVEDLSKFTGSVDENGNVIMETITTTYTQEEYDALESKDGITPDITKEEYDALTEEEKEAYTLSYSKTETVNAGDQIFVFGQEVDDFNFLRKETVFTITTAALQEVDRQQQADKERIATLEGQVAALLSRVEALENSNP